MRDCCNCQNCKPDPIPARDLYGMVGEPVWVVWADGRMKSRWWIVGSLEWLRMEFDTPLSVLQYGETWNAYLCKVGVVQ